MKAKACENTTIIEEQKKEKPGTRMKGNSGEEGIVTYKKGGNLVKNVNNFAGGLAFVVGLGGHFRGGRVKSLIECLNGQREVREKNRG